MPRVANFGIPLTPVVKGVVQKYFADELEVYNYPPDLSLPFWGQIDDVVKRAWWCLGNAIDYIILPNHMMTAVGIARQLPEAGIIFVSRGVMGPSVIIAGPRTSVTAEDLT